MGLEVLAGGLLVLGFIVSTSMVLVGLRQTQRVPSPVLALLRRTAEDSLAPSHRHANLIVFGLFTAFIVSAQLVDLYRQAAHDQGRLGLLVCELLGEAAWITLLLTNRREVQTGDK